MKVSLKNLLLPALAVAAVVMMAGCPLPFDYKGPGANTTQASDPSSPNVTAPVIVSYSVQGGSSGTVADGGSFYSGQTTTVTLSTATADAVIFYTDTSAPLSLTSLASAKKINGSNGAMTLARTTSVQTLDIHAMAIGPNMLPSTIVHAVVGVSPYPVLSIASDKASVSEDGGTATFTVTSSAAPSSDITVHLLTGGTYLATDITSTAISPLPASGGSVTATLKQSTTTISVSITGAGAHDAVSATQTFTLTIQPDPSQLTTYSVGAPASASVLIQDVPALTLTASPTIFADGQNATFTVTSSFAPSAALTVNLSSSGYAAGTVTVPASVTLPAGSASATFLVTAPAQGGGFTVQTPQVSLAAGTGYAVGSPGTQSLIVSSTAYAFSGLWDFAGGTVSSIAGGAPAWTITGSVPIVGGSLNFSGNYSADYVTTNVAAVFNQNLFTVGVGFRLSDLSAVHPIIAGGFGYRWLIVQSDLAGNLSLQLNNHAAVINLPGFTVTPGTDHTLVVSINTAALTVTARLDNVQFSGTLPAGFVWNNPPGQDLVLTSNDFSSGNAMAGLWHWIFIANQ